MPPEKLSMAGRESARLTPTNLGAPSICECLPKNRAWRAVNRPAYPNQFGSTEYLRMPPEKPSLAGRFTAGQARFFGYGQTIGLIMRFCDDRARRRRMPRPDIAGPNLPIAPRAPL